MAAALRGLVIGGLIVTHSICTASTVSPPRLSPKVHLLPQINFQKKGTEIPIRVHVMHSPVLDFAPWLELHHVVFVGEVGSKKVYAIDYSPLNQSENIMKLLFGLDVQAEIRVRLLNADDINDMDDVKRKWSCLNVLAGNSKIPSTEEVLMTDQDLLLSQKFIRRIIKRWDTSMNLYTHNCQHFSSYVKDLLKGEEVCPL